MRHDLHFSSSVEAHDHSAASGSGRRAEPGFVKSEGSAAAADGCHSIAFDCGHRLRGGCDEIEAPVKRILRSCRKEK
jgi:hypothetical protein